MTLLRMILAFSIVTLLVACSGPPTESDARNALESKIQRQSNGLIKIAAFQKTNGMAREYGGIKAYEFDYVAEIEFTDDCMWGGGGPFGWDGSFEATRGQPHGALDSFNPKYFGKQAANKGQRQKVSGKFAFEKTERGWRLTN